MIIKQFKDPVTYTMTYVIAKSIGGEAVIIDPVFENVAEYIKYLKLNNLKLIKAIDTHTHQDHYSGIDLIKKYTKCATVVPKESKILESSERMHDGGKIKIDDITLTCLYTPGHTDDSYCLHMEGYLFTGDTLFIRGNGRADLSGGDPAHLYDSITKLFALPDSTTIFPGHDYKGETQSTIKIEKIENPRYYNKSKAEFIEIMNNLNLRTPKLMDSVVPANKKIGNINTDKERLHEFEILSPEDLRNWMDFSLLIDLRTDDEIRRSGSIDAPNTIHIPYEKLDKIVMEIKNGTHKICDTIKQKKAIIFYCDYGQKSIFAIQKFKEVYSNISHLNGGYNIWHKYINEKLEMIEEL